MSVLLGEITPTGAEHGYYLVSLKQPDILVFDHFNYETGTGEKIARISLTVGKFILGSSGK